jgi:hypothetical protein
MSINLRRYGAVSVSAVKAAFASKSVERIVFLGAGIATITGVSMWPVMRFFLVRPVEEKLNQKTVELETQNEGFRRIYGLDADQKRTQLETEEHKRLEEIQIAKAEQKRVMDRGNEILD